MVDRQDPEGSTAESGGKSQVTGHVDCGRLIQPHAFTTKASKQALKRFILRLAQRHTLPVNQLWYERKRPFGVSSKNDELITVYVCMSVCTYVRTYVCTEYTSLASRVFL